MVPNLTVLAPVNATPLVLKNCDRVLSLPMKGHIDSLNASVAAGVLLYAAVKNK